METQHFYSKQKEPKKQSFMSKLFGLFKSSNDDVKKAGMHQYVYSYQPGRKLEKNETVKGGHFYKPNKYIVNNIDKLEEWSGLKYSSVLYDSKRDGKDFSIFREKIIKHGHLNFIVIDLCGNVFGHYHDNVIDSIYDDNKDSKIFMFTLNSNGRCGVKKFDNKHRDTGTFFDDDYFFYNCGYGHGY